MKKAILISCYGWYDRRLKYVEKVLLNKGYIVKYYTSNFDHVKKEYITEVEFADAIHVEVPGYKRNISIKRLYSLAQFSKKITNIISQEEPVLVYCLIPPNSLARDLAILKRKRGFNLVFDIIDLWPESMPISKYKDNYIFKRWGRLRDNYLDDAELIITECDFYQHILKDVTRNEKMETIYLCKEKSAISKMSNIDESKITLCYLGSINNIIDIDLIGEVIKMISQLKPVILKIIGDGERKSDLINIAEENGAMIIDYGKIYDQRKKQEIFNTCDYGLNLYKSSTNIGLTAKSIDYIEAELPIINNIKYDTFEMIKKYNCGVNIDKLQSFCEYYKHNDIQRKMCKNLFDDCFSHEVIYNRVSDVFERLG